MPLEATIKKRVQTLWQTCEFGEMMSLAGTPHLRPIYLRETPEADDVTCISTGCLRGDIITLVSAYLLILSELYWLSS